MRILRNNTRKNRLIKRLRDENLTVSELRNRDIRLREKTYELIDSEWKISEYDRLNEENPRLQAQIDLLDKQLKEARADLEPLIKVKHRYIELIKDLDIKDEH